MDHYKLYTSLTNKRTYLEIWGASTKHPDQVRCFESDCESKKFINNEYFSVEDNIFQWLLYIASGEFIPFHAYELTEYALEWYTLLHK